MSTNHHPSSPSHGSHGQTSHHVHQGHQGSASQPVLVPPTDTVNNNADPAVDFIRQKLAALYRDEPDAKQEMTEAQLPGIPHSKHQQYMLSLHQSGKSASEIQTAWHQYYSQLNDIEKRQVWQEFYDQSAQSKQHALRIEPHYTYVPDEPKSSTSYRQPTPPPNTRPQPTSQTPPTPQSIYPTPTALEPSFGRPPQAASVSTVPTATTTPIQAKTSQPLDAAHNPLLTTSGGQQPSLANPIPVPPADDTRPADTIRQQLRDTVASRSTRLQAKHHLQSLLFGLGFGAVTILIVLFGFFNEVVIAPFIQPSRTVTATPIIVSPDGVTPSDKNEIIIPKINVQIPLDFSAKTTNEKEFEAALDKGVAHYPTTALPGQQGNASFFGHSSNNIFNPGKYKFAFVMLNELVPGDTFYITYNGVAYAYTVYDKKVVEATAVEILNPVAGKTATAMLVTCDPPGTSLKRLAVWGEQISPNPNSNAAATPPAAQPQPEDSADLPGNGPTLWGRFLDWITSN